MSKNKITYANSGVNIETGNKLIDIIKPSVASTKRPGVMGSIGGFGGLFDLKSCNYKDPILVSATDGVGTKLKIAISTNNYDSIGQDLVAMCVNDLIVQGAEPLFFLDYYACSKLNNNNASKVIASIAKACKLANCALIGGETAEMPDMYHNDDIDLAGFAVGVVEREQILPQKENIKTGDLVIGIPSSGIHSNGFSLVRKIMSSYNLDYEQISEFNKDKTYAEGFLTPTAIYVKPCLELCKKQLVKALCHITGGGLIENIPRILPPKLSFSIDYTSLKLPPIFQWLKNKANIDNEEIYKTFNCGIGMAIIIDKNNYQKVSKILSQHNYNELIKLGEIKQSNEEKL